MWVGPLYWVVMYQGSSTPYGSRAHKQPENWTTGGLVLYLLVVPVAVAFMAAPTVMVGAVLGVVAYTLGRRLVRWLRCRSGGSGPSTRVVKSRPRDTRT